MLEIRDLRLYQKDRFGLYGGRSGSKYGILIDGARWMIKFPENTRGFPGREKANHHIPSYKTSPICEHIGSKIYQSLGIPVHETQLGYRDGKIVVACKDFDPFHTMVDYGKIKNAVLESEADFTGSSSGRNGEVLTDVLKVMEVSDILKDAPGVKERFWDMFVVDAFIRNNDRNNGNWGVFLNGDGTVALAPVFDNGNALFNKRNPSVAKRRLMSQEQMEEDALGTGTSFFTDETGKHIHPFAYMAATKDADCCAAILRFAERLDMNRICRMIDEIPHMAYGLEVITSVQKEYYKKIFEMIMKKGVQPIVEKIQRSGTV